MLSVKLFCPLYPSEDPDKVKAAILNIFPDAKLEVSSDRVEGITDNLKKFAVQIRKQEILDTTRALLLKGTRGGTNRIVVHLNKQVAFMGLISFSEERTVLGTIRVTIENNELETLIQNVAPETVDGKEVLI
ncbi:MAG: RNA-binding domain-containing protein [Candidatus Methanomethylophilaceae archaeon]